jgi:hypothetical protein
MNILMKMVGSGFLLFVTIATGVWLHNSAKPFNTFLFTAHKLIALGFVIHTSIVMYNALKNSPIGTMAFILMLVAGLSCLVLFVSGALLSMGTAEHEMLLMLHNITTGLAVISAATLMYRMLL